MIRVSKHGKRCLSLVLTLVLLASNLNLGLVRQALAVEETVQEITDGSLVANHYELTEGEESLLNSGLLAGDTHSYVAPTDSDDLISVDTETKTVTAADYTDSQDNTWRPVSAVIVAGGEVQETLPITGNTCTYTYTGNAFSVKVTYKLSFTVAEADQQRLLGTAGWIRSGLKNLDDASAADSTSQLSVIGEAAETLALLAGEGFTANGFPVGFTNEDAKTAALALKAQTDANGSNQLDLAVMLDDYIAASSKTEYLLTQGAALKEKLIETRDYVAAILDDSVWTNVDSLTSEPWWSMITDESVKQKLTLAKALKSNMENWKASADTVLAGDWTAAEQGTALVKTDVDYAALDSRVDALPETLTDVSTLAIEETLPAASAVVQYNMSMFNVSVKAVLKTVETADDSDTLVERDTSTGSVTLEKGASMDDVLAAIGGTGLEANSKRVWTDAYGLDLETYFDRSVDTNVGETLTTDSYYTITYTPKDYTVTRDYAEPMTVPYGYRMTLPVHADPTLAYDYRVNGVYYPQGEVYTVTGGVSVTRTEGRAYTPTDLYQVIAGSFALTEKEKAILTSGALNNNVTINVRYPNPDGDALVTLTDNTLRAKKYPSDCEGLMWEPYSYTVVNEATGERWEYRFDGSTEVTVRESTYDKIEVVYRLTLDNFGDDQLLTALNLPKTLADEASVQLAVLNRLSADSVYNNMGQLDKTKLGALNGVIDVTDLNSDPVKNEELKTYFKGIVSNIIANCLDTDSSLKIYNMLTAYRDPNNGGLSYYYNNSAAVRLEISKISGYLSQMLADQ